MAYTRKVQKPNIRSLNVKSLPSEKESKFKAVPHSSETATTVVLHHNPIAEVKRIALCGIPLILILAVGGYFDTTHHWVISLANWLMRLGT